MYQGKLLVDVYLGCIPPPAESIECRHRGAFVKRHDVSVIVDESSRMKTVIYIICI